MRSKQGTLASAQIKAQQQVRAQLIQQCTRQARGLTNCSLSAINHAQSSSSNVNNITPVQRKQKVVPKLIVQKDLDDRNDYLTKITEEQLISKPEYGPNKLSQSQNASFLQPPNPKQIVRPTSSLKPSEYFSQSANFSKILDDSRPTMLMNNGNNSTTHLELLSVGNSTSHLNRPVGMDSVNGSNTSARGRPSMNDLTQNPVQATCNFAKQDETTSFWQQNTLASDKNSLIYNKGNVSQVQKPVVSQRGLFVAEQWPKKQRCSSQKPKEPEHNLTGSQMASVMGVVPAAEKNFQIDFKPTRTTYKSPQPQRSAAPIVWNVKPIQKAHEASQQNLWEDLQKSVESQLGKLQTKKQRTKQLTKECYFTSQCTTLPGPDCGLHQTKVQKQILKEKQDLATPSRGTLQAQDKFFGSRILTLDNQKISSKENLLQISHQRSHKDVQRYVNQNLAKSRLFKNKDELRQCQKATAGKPTTTTDVVPMVKIQLEKKPQRTQIHDGLVWMRTRSSDHRQNSAKALKKEFHSQFTFNHS